MIQKDPLHSTLTLQLIHTLRVNDDPYLRADSVYISFVKGWPNVLNITEKLSYISFSVCNTIVVKIFIAQRKIPCSKSHFFFLVGTRNGSCL